MFQFDFSIIFLKDYKYFSFFFLKIINIFRIYVKSFNYSEIKLN